MQDRDMGAKPSASNKPGGANIFQFFDRKFIPALKKESILGAIVLFFLMLLTTADVVGRYFFNHPIPGADELTGLVLVCLAASAFAYSQIKKGNIRVELIIERLSPRARIISDAVAFLFCLVGASLITWQTFIRAVNYMFATRGQVTQILGVPIFPFMLILALGFFLLAVVSLIDFIRTLARVVAK